MNLTINFDIILVKMSFLFYFYKNNFKKKDNVKKMSILSKIGYLKKNMKKIRMTHIELFGIF